MMPTRPLVLATTLLVCACSGSSSGPAPSGPGVDATSCAPSRDPAYQGMPDTAQIYHWIERMVGFGRRITGTPAGYKASAYVKCEMEKLGLSDVHYETVSSWLWELDEAALSLGGEPVDAYPSAYSFATVDQPAEFATPAGGLQAEVIDIGRAGALDMASQDVAGKIVLFDLKFLLPPLGLAPLAEFFWDPALTVLEPSLVVGNPYLTNYSEALKAAMDAGAVGFIGVLADYFESNRYNNEYYRRTQVTIPGFWVSPAEGARLRQRLGEGRNQASLVMKGRRKEVEARTVIGFLEGASKDTIMVQSHLDSVSPGAVEDGSGTAAVLAQAQYFASQPASSRSKTLMFALFDTHFSGYQSHMAFAEKYLVKRETPYRIVANVTLEHIGRQGIKGPDGRLQVTDLPELRGVLNSLGPTLKLTMMNSIIRHDLRRTFLLSGHALCATAGMPTDASFICLNGVPTASLIAGPNYLYDDADTLDKVMVEDLVPTTQVFLELIEAIDDTPSMLIGLPLPHLGPVLGL